MKLYVLFGQRIQQYSGQYGLEALSCATEHDDDSNPEYMPEQLQKYSDLGEFEGLVIVTMEVSEGEINKILSPSHVVKAKVIA